jgi:Tol biopolymer transport system component
VELSPDGTRVLVSLLDPLKSTRDLWMYDVKRGLRTRFTFDPSNESTGTWSPDGLYVVFNSNRKSRLDLYRKASSGAGSEELLVSDDQDKEPYSWSDDGRFVAYHTLAATGGQTGQNLWAAPSTGDGKLAVILQTQFNERFPRFSPDGRWLAYASTESGRAEIYVTSFPVGRGKWQVSAAGGDWPRWRRDGRELFYLAPDNTVMSAVVEGRGAAFDVGVITPLFKAQPRPLTLGTFREYEYDVSANGQRFLINTPLEEVTSADPITLLVNWPALLKK